MRAVPTMISLQAVHAGYGRVEVLHGIDLEILEGSVFALLGPNGGGKSTLVKVVGGALRPSGGRVLVGGQDTANISPVALARAGLCTIPEGRGTFPNLTVSENLWMMRTAARTQDEVLDEAFDWFPALAGKHQQRAGSLSGGEQQMLALARAIVSRPTVLLLDEISTGLSPRAVSVVYDAVAQLAEQGLTVVLAEQAPRAAMAIATSGALLHRGRVEAFDPTSASADVLDSVYLGATSHLTPSSTPRRTSA